MSDVVSKIRTVLVGDAQHLMGTFHGAEEAAKNTGKHMEDSFDKSTSHIGGLFNKLGNEASSFGVPMSGVLNDIGKSFERAGSKGKGLLGLLSGMGALAVGGGLAAFAGVAGAAVKIALEGEPAFAKLKTAIDNSGSSMAKAGPTIDATTESMRQAGFTADETASALATLVTATGSVAKGHQQMALAANLARFQHISLAEAATMVAKIDAGRGTRVAASLGINPLIGNATAGSVLKAKEAHDRALAQLAKAEAGKDVSSSSSSRVSALTKLQRLQTEASWAAAARSKSESRGNEMTKSQLVAILRAQGMTAKQASAAAASQISDQNALYSSQRRSEAQNEAAIRQSWRMQDAQQALTGSTSKHVVNLNAVAAAQAAVARTGEAYRRDLSTTTTLLDAIGGKVKNASKNYADTYQGRIDTLKATLHNWGEDLGKWLIPKLELVTGWLEEMFKWIEAHKQGVREFAIGLGAVATALSGIWAYNKVRGIFSDISNAGGALKSIGNIGSGAGIGSNAGLEGALSANTDAVLANTTALGGMDAALATTDTALATTDGALGAGAIAGGKGGGSFVGGALGPIAALAVGTILVSGIVNAAEVAISKTTNPWKVSVIGLVGGFAHLGNTIGGFFGISDNHFSRSLNSFANFIVDGIVHPSVHVTKTGPVGKLNTELLYMDAGQRAYFDAYVNKERKQGVHLTTDQLTAIATAMVNAWRKLPDQGVNAPPVTIHVHDQKNPHSAAKAVGYELRTMAGRR